MPTDLTVKITDGTGSTVYTLKVERIQHQMQRTPTTTPLPGDPSTGEPTVFQFDFGYNLEIIQVQGLVDVAGSVQAGDTFPSAAELRTAMKTILQSRPLILLIPFQLQSQHPSTKFS